MDTRTNRTAERVDRSRDFLAIVGPTGSGKTELSLRVAACLDAEIISMDSRQVYRGMDVGTAKASLKDRARARHHGLDLRDPNERYSAGQFARDARTWIRQIRGRGRVPLLVGGTGFFLRALIEPLFREPAIDRSRLERLRAYLNRLRPDELEAWLAALDPRRAAMAVEGGRNRQTRTLEVALLTGRALSWWHAQGAASAPPLRGLVVLLQLPREELYERINRRVEAMVSAGLAGEVENLLAAGYGAADPGMTGAGYRQIVDHLLGRSTLEEAVEGIRRSHRRYARRQITWYRHQLPGGVLGMDASKPLETLAREVIGAWKHPCPASERARAEDMEGEVQ